jgi:hypothetical protein
MKAIEHLDMPMRVSSTGRLYDGNISLLWKRESLEYFLETQRDQRGAKVFGACRCVNEGASVMEAGFYGASDVSSTIALRF